MTKKWRFLFFVDPWQPGIDLSSVEIERLLISLTVKSKWAYLHSPPPKTFLLFTNDFSTMGEYRRRRRTFHHIIVSSVEVAHTCRWSAPDCA